MAETKYFIKMTELDGTIKYATGYDSAGQFTFKVLSPTDDKLIIKEGYFTTLGNSVKLTLTEPATIQFEVVVEKYYICLFNIEADTYTFMNTSSVFSDSGNRAEYATLDAATLVFTPIQNNYPGYTMRIIRSTDSKLYDAATGIRFNDLRLYIKLLDVQTYINQSGLGTSSTYKTTSDAITNITNLMEAGLSS